MRQPTRVALQKCTGGLCCMNDACVFLLSRNERNRTQFTARNPMCQQCGEQPAEVLCDFCRYLYWFGETIDGWPLYAVVYEPQEIHCCSNFGRNRSKPQMSPEAEAVVQTMVNSSTGEIIKTIRGSIIQNLSSYNSLDDVLMVQLAVVYTMLETVTTNLSNPGQMQELERHDAKEVQHAHKRVKRDLFGASTHDSSITAMEETINNFGMQFVTQHNPTESEVTWDGNPDAGEGVCRLHVLRILLAQTCGRCGFAAPFKWLFKMTAGFGFKGTGADILHRTNRGGDDPLNTAAICVDGTHERVKNMMTLAAHVYDFVQRKLITIAQLEYPKEIKEDQRVHICFWRLTQRRLRFQTRDEAAAIDASAYMLDEFL
jgi:hypothetical protein